MAEIYELDAHRPNQDSQKAQPLARNQEILAKIQAAWSARTPDEIRMAEIRGTEEELKGVQRRYDELIAAHPQALWPSEIAKANQQKQPDPDHGKGNGHEHDGGYSM
jgi:hypothetical protein